MITGMRAARRPERVRALRESQALEADDQVNEGTGYTVLSYLLAGMIAYGGLGWLIGHYVVHVFMLFPAGLLVGLAISVGWIIYRYGRPHELGNDSPKGDDR
jgi:ATP synthase protein I